MLVPYKYEEQGRPVGKRENCQINDIHTQKGETSHPPDQPRRPQMSLWDYLVQEVGRSKPQKLGSKHLETLVGRGRVRQGDLTCGSPTRPAPLPWDEMLGSGPGARVHTHTHTHHTPEARTRLLSYIHTHTHAHTHPMCTQMHKDTNSTHSPRMHTRECP